MTRDEQIRLYMVEHRKCVERVISMARLDGPGVPTAAALATCMILLFQVAQQGQRLPGYIVASGLGGIDIGHPSDPKAPPVKINSAGEIAYPRKAEAPAPDNVVRLVVPDGRDG